MSGAFMLLLPIPWYSGIGWFLFYFGSQAEVLLDRGVGWISRDGCEDGCGDDERVANIWKETILGKRRSEYLLFSSVLHIKNTLR